MYVHKRCCPSNGQLDMEKTTHGYCGICRNQGTVYLIVGTEDAYKYKRQGVTYTVIEGIEQGVNVTGTVVIDEIAPVEMPLEPELTEETEAVEEVAETALEEILEEVVEEEKEPDKVDVEAEPEVPIEVATYADSADGPDTAVEAEQPLEAESEPSIEIPEEAAEMPPVGLVEAEPRLLNEEELEAEVKKGLLAEEARKAKIARLEAELAELQK